MGQQDRDYWKERYDENMGIRSQPKSRRNQSDLGKLRFFSAAKTSSRLWIFLLQVMLFVCICLGVFAVFWMINSLR